MTKRIRTAASGAIALTLALMLLAGCSGKPGSVAEAPGKPPAADQGDRTGSGTGDNAGNRGNDAGAVNKNDTGDGGTVAPSQPSDPSAGSGGNGPNAGGGTNGNGGTNANGGAKPGTGNDANAGGGKSEPDSAKPKVVASNEAFRVYGPAPDSVVGKTFKVKGQARVFEAAFGYSFEDGHNVLAEGHAMADKGAPAWGEFELDIALQEPPSSPTGVLTIYEASAKDGSHVHELHIAYTFDKSILKLEGE
ncbi:Gmad2 immunoglobulin-like domain-containing protein [Paenibacillus sp. MWE-103]|uniref:Gmad2 immunoglobulin-like domain-containing protein n=1 Tax=Paenibacillus artemisiicola TaxID=1172618 RepID=A0ABS3WKG3_9BACL|nr:Gmad2 immunoglobulin-like domain-containing protein [Paenibacillus artemisiicola]MBO7748821.1 Gmad2 immunoglobulin-like domain-containing protein [Paenibacillus artemisiicola]